MTFCKPPWQNRPSIQRSNGSVLAWMKNITCYQLEQRGQLFFLSIFITDILVQSTHPCLKLHTDEILEDESETRCLVLQCILCLTVKMTSQTQGFSFPFTVPKSYIFFETVFFPIVLSLKNLIMHIDINKA